MLSAEMCAFASFTIGPTFAKAVAFIFNHAFELKASEVSALPLSRLALPLRVPATTTTHCVAQRSGNCSCEPQTPCNPSEGTDQRAGIRS